MQIISNAFGSYQTNCYILKVDNKDFIIDPGDGAYEWVLRNVTNPQAILITHGHFDHIFDVGILKREFKLPVYMHKDDVFMVAHQSDIYGYELFETDFAVDEGKVSIGGNEFRFNHFAGHTPGCCMIEFRDVMFSGDFLFKGSIGRWDFEFSDANDMISSIFKCERISGDYKIYPGHGPSTTLKAERGNFLSYVSYIKSSIH